MATAHHDNENGQSSHEPLLQRSAGFIGDVSVLTGNLHHFVTISHKLITWPIELYRKLHAANAEIERLNLLINSEDPGRFPYTTQFTPTETTIASTSTHIPIFRLSRAPMGGRNWVYETMPAHKLLSEWFKFWEFPKHAALVGLEDEWGALHDEDVHVWKGKRGNMDVEQHPWLNKMYPFVAVGSNHTSKLPTEGDPRIYIVLMFFERAKRLCAKELQTGFALNKLSVTDKYLYLDGDFVFRDIVVRPQPRGRPKATPMYILKRQMIVVGAGRRIYTVTTGVPHASDEYSEYTGHVHRWLTEFQLGPHSEYL